MLNRLVLSVSVVVAVVVSSVHSAHAQPLADRIPSDAVIYVGWAGADSMGPGYDGSHLKAILDAAELPKFINEAVPKAIQRLASREREAAQAAKVVDEMVRPMWRHATALYVGPVDMANPRQPMPRLAVLCDAGDDAARMRDGMQELLRQAGGNAPVKMVVRSAGSVVALVVGDVPEIDAVLNGNAKSRALIASKSFAATVALDKSPTVAAYVDVEAALKLVDDAVETGRDANAKEKWPAVRDALGLRGLKRVSLVQGFDGKDWGAHAFIEAPAPRQGLLAGFDAKPVSDEALRVIPAGATLAGVTRLDLAGLFDGIRNAIPQLDAKAGRDVEKAIGQVNALLGMDLRQDVLAALGDEWSYFIAPEVTGRGPLGVVVVNRLKDPAKAQEASDNIKGLVNSAIKAANKEPNVNIAFKQTKVGDLTVHYLAVPFVTPSWAIQGGNLYMGLYPQLVAQAASHSAAGGKSILDNAGFVALRKRLGDQKAVSLQFYDLPKSAATSYQVWMMLSSFAKFGDVIGVDTPALLLPPLGTLTQHLGVAGSVSWVDEAGWHFRAVSPFPGSVTMTSETAGLMDVQSSALMMSILLPALNKSREQANRIKSASNLRQIGLAVQIYANEHKGKFPDEISQTLDEDITAAVFVNPRSNTSLPPGLQGDALKRWVNESSDYVYVGKGLTYQAGADTVIAYEKPEGLQDGVNFLYADGHVEFQIMPVAMDLIEKAKGRAR
jgi:prepilin-type processing-associated H-X9-DG protein